MKLTHALALLIKPAEVAWEGGRMGGGMEGWEGRDR